jgi:hypothetical protein
MNDVVNWAVLIGLVLFALTVIGGTLYGCVVAVRLAIEEIRHRRKNR